MLSTPLFAVCCEGPHLDTAPMRFADPLAPRSGERVRERGSFHPRKGGSAKMRPLRRASSVSSAKSVVASPAKRKCPCSGFANEHGVRKLLILNGLHELRCTRRRQAIHLHCRKPIESFIQRHGR